MVTVVQGKVCAKNHPDRLSRLATIHQRYRRTDGRTDGRISYGIGLDLTVGQKKEEQGLRLLIFILPQMSYLSYLKFCLQSLLLLRTVDLTLVCDL